MAYEYPAYGQTRQPMIEEGRDSGFGRRGKKYLVSAWVRDFKKRFKCSGGEIRQEGIV